MTTTTKQTATTKILEFLKSTGTSGATKTEIMKATGLPDNTVRGRLSELYRAWDIVKWNNMNSRNTYYGI